MEKLTEETVLANQHFNTNISILLGILIVILYIIYTFTGDLEDMEFSGFFQKLPALITLILLGITLSAPLPGKNIYIGLTLVSLVLTLLTWGFIAYLYALGKGFNH